MGWSCSCSPHSMPLCWLHRVCSCRKHPPLQGFQKGIMFNDTLYFLIFLLHTQNKASPPMQQVYQPECRMVVSPFLHFLSFAKNGHFPGHLLSHPAHPPAFPDTSLHTSLSPLKVKVLPAAINYFPPLGPGSPAPPPRPQKGA